MTGGPVVLHDKIISDSASFQRHFDKRTTAEAAKFYRCCARLYSPHEYYLKDWQGDSKHPWFDRSFSEVLDEIKDPTARKYIAVSSRSDIATEPYLTSALNGLKNVLMNDARYIRLYSIKGGIERLIDRLVSEVSAEVRLNSAVVRIGRTPHGTYRITSRCEDRLVSDEFDVVMLALPNYWLGQIEWDDAILAKRLQEHVASRPRSCVLTETLYGKSLKVIIAVSPRRSAMPLLDRKQRLSNLRTVAWFGSQVATNHRMGGGARAQISGGRPAQVQIDPQKPLRTTCYSAKGDLLRNFPFRHEIPMRDEGIAPCILLLRFMPRLVAFDYLPAVQKGFGKECWIDPESFWQQ
jgi:hypothetical protein